MKPPFPSPESAAGVAARFLKARGVDRVFALCGGHIMPIWMRDRRGGHPHHRRARRACRGAHGARPRRAHRRPRRRAGHRRARRHQRDDRHRQRARRRARRCWCSPGSPPRPQENRGALQDIGAHRPRPLDHALRAHGARAVARSRRSSTRRSRARSGRAGSRGRSISISRPTRCAPTCRRRCSCEEHFRPKPRARGSARSRRRSRRGRRAPLVGAAPARHHRARRARRRAGARASPRSLGAVYLDTGESRGLVPDEHPSVVAAMRGAVMGEADVVVTVGRRLDFQLAYGSPAVFGAARFVRIADAPSRAARQPPRRRRDLRQPARGARTRSSTPRARARPPSDRSWTSGLRARHDERVAKLAADDGDAAPGTRRTHAPEPTCSPPCRTSSPPMRSSSPTAGTFWRSPASGSRAATYLDPGAFGCIGVGVPFGIAASLRRPDRGRSWSPPATAPSASTPIELDTAVRHRAPVVYRRRQQRRLADRGARPVGDLRPVVGTRCSPRTTRRWRARSAARRARRARRGSARCLRARASPTAPRSLDVVVTTDAVSSDAKSGLAWVPDLQPLAAWDDAERTWRQG